MFNKKLSYAMFFVCITFAFYCLSSSVLAKANLSGVRHYSQNNYENVSKQDIRQYTQEAINYLDKLADRFDNLTCPAKDDFCWWFLFHLNIGESGSSSMIDFVESVPVKNFSSLRKNSFPGESHLFQYPSYWLIKGVPTDTQLSDGQTVQEFVFSKDWVDLFQRSEDKEPSWYWFGQVYYPDLPQISFFPEPSQTSCQASHYLVGLSLKDKRRFNKLLKAYYYNLKRYSETIKPADAINNPYVSDLVVHSFEAFCLSGRKDLIDKELFFYNLKYLEEYAKAFDESFAKVYSLNDFVQLDSEIAYNTAEVLGHFRYGLKICSSQEPYPF